MRRQSLPQLHCKRTDGWSSRTASNNLRSLQERILTAGERSFHFYSSTCEVVVSSFAEGCWITSWCRNFHCGAPQSSLEAKRGTVKRVALFRLAKALFTRVPCRSHEDWNTHRQPSASVMDINLMRRVKKQQLTERAQSQINWFRMRAVPFIIRKT